MNKIALILLISEFANIKAMDQLFNHGADVKIKYSRGVLPVIIAFREYNNLKELEQIQEQLEIRHAIYKLLESKLKESV